MIRLAFFSEGSSSASMEPVSDGTGDIMASRVDRPLQSMRKARLEDKTRKQ